MENIEYTRTRDNKVQHVVMDGRKAHPLHKTWRAMITRCYCKSAGNYATYGGRGITVCEEWRNDFWQFVKDMGERPSKDFSIDRIDVNKGYSKENCRWANRYEQQANRRTTNKNGCVGILKNKASNRYYAEIGGKKHRVRKSFKTLNEAVSWREQQLASLSKGETTMEKIIAKTNGKEMGK